VRVEQYAVPGGPQPLFDFAAIRSADDVREFAAAYGPLGLLSEEGQDFVEPIEAWLAFSRGFRWVLTTYDRLRAAALGSRSAVNDLLSDRNEPPLRDWWELVGTMSPFGAWPEDQRVMLAAKAAIIRQVTAALRLDPARLTLASALPPEEDSDAGGWP